MEQVALGLVGCGHMGRDFIRLLDGLEVIRFSAVCDILEQQAKSLGEQLNVPWFTSLDEMLDKGDLQAVIIATPPYLHREHVEKSAAAGKHIFCEKPMAANVGDCDAMIAACEKAGVKLMIGQVLRYLPTWHTVIETARSGELGRIIGVSIARVGGGFGSWEEPWRNSLEQSGGLLMEVNSHEIDFVRCLAGEVESVFCMAEHFIQPRTEAPDQIYVVLRFRGGALGVLQSGMVSAIGESSGRIMGEKGSVIYRHTWGHEGHLDKALFGQEPQRTLVKDIQIEDGFRREVREFAEAVLSDGPVTIPGSEGRANIEVAQAAYLSAKTGKLVRLPL
jgi:glucose-fructose oxidoreductase